MKRIRTGIIGCGKVGQIHIEAHSSVAESELVAVCDPDWDRAAAFAAKCGAKAFTDVDDMLSHGAVEAVSICTPHPLHAEPAIQAAAAGVHVLVEKPMAANLTDCDAMLAAAGKTGVKLGVVSQRRFYEPVKRMKDAIDAGKIGRPILGLFLGFNWRDEAYYQSDPWRGKWATEGGGVLVNQSSHHLDMLQWMMGEIDEIGGYWANVNHPFIEVDDTAVACIRFKNGGLGSIVTSISQKPGLFMKIHVHGSSGASIGVETDRGASFIAGASKIAEPPLNDLWTIPGEEHLLSEFEAEDRRTFASVNAMTHYHALQIRDFLQSILADRDPLVTGEDGRIVVEMFTAIYRANQEGLPVRFPVRTE
ncbi:MAG: Gfo/Idh/MocA family oxidoreductase [Planctomycetota bacterium]|nr:Gfo/Idh/MocA family oxidoreductase [Planctomycetota bacterium]